MKHKIVKEPILANTMSWFLFNLHKMNGILKTEVYSMNGNSVEFRNQAFVGVVKAVN